MAERRGEPQVIIRYLNRGTQLQMTTVAGRHSYILDEPEIRGGDDLGGTPFEFFVAGYGG